jgi:hypothetical protein
LLTVQLAGCGPLIAAVFDLCQAPRPLLVRLTRWSWIAFLIGVVTGLIVGVVQVVLLGRDYGVAMRLLSYKLGWGVAELIVYAASMLLYLWGWRGSLRQTRLRRSLHMFIAVFAATNLLYHFPTLMLLYARIVSGRLQLEVAVDAATYRRLAFAGEVLAGTVHFWMASLATTGIVIAWLVARHGGEEDVRTGIWGSRVGLAASLLQLPIGIWLLSTLPQIEQRRLLGDDILATGLLGLAFFAALSLMHQLASISFGQWSERAAKRAGVTLVLVMVLMVGATMRMGM